MLKLLTDVALKVGSMEEPSTPVKSPSESPESPTRKPPSKSVSFASVDSFDGEEQQKNTKKELREMRKKNAEYVP